MVRVRKRPHATIRARAYALIAAVRAVGVDQGALTRLQEQVEQLERDARRRGRPPGPGAAPPTPVSSTSGAPAAMDR